MTDMSAEAIEALISGLMNYSQADQDGVICTTSRQAVHMAEDMIRALSAELAASRAREAVLVAALQYCARDDGTHPENRKTVARDALARVQP